MDPNPGIKQDPTPANNGAVSFAPGIDMTAINEAVNAHSGNPNIQSAPAPASTPNPLAAELEKEIADTAEEVITAETPDMNSIPVESNHNRDNASSISELANSVNSDPSVSAAPDALPPAGAQNAQMDPAANLEESKSKLPTYILIGLSILAAASVFIAVIVSIG